MNYSPDPDIVRLADVDAQTTVVHNAARWLWGTDDDDEYGEYRHDPFGGDPHRCRASEQAAALRRLADFIDVTGIDLDQPELIPCSAPGVIAAQTSDRKALIRSYLRDWWELMVAAGFRCDVRVTDALVGLEADLGGAVRFTEHVSNYGGVNDDETPRRLFRSVSDVGLT